MAENGSMTRSEGQNVEEHLYKVWPFRRSDEGADEGIAFPVDICETEEAFLLLGDLPGVRKEDLEVRLADNELAIKGRVMHELDHDEAVAIREIPGADYKRSFTLSDAVDPGKITAELTEGILKISMAKAEHVKPREIEITG